MRIAGHIRHDGTGRNGENHRCGCNLQRAIKLLGFWYTDNTLVSAKPNLWTWDSIQSKMP
jgi:hypothetical protein